MGGRSALIGGDRSLRLLRTASRRGGEDGFARFARGSSIRPPAIGPARSSLPFRYRASGILGDCRGDSGCDRLIEADCDSSLGSGGGWAMGPVPNPRSRLAISSMPL